MKLLEHIYLIPVLIALGILIIVTVVLFNGFRLEKQANDFCNERGLEYYDMRASSFFSTTPSAIECFNTTDNIVKYYKVNEELWKKK